MNHPTHTQCCAFAAWSVLSETLAEQVWALMCPTHGQTGREVVLTRRTGARLTASEPDAAPVARPGRTGAHRGSRAA